LGCFSRGFEAKIKPEKPEKLISSQTRRRAKDLEVGQEKIRITLRHPEMLRPDRRKGISGLQHDKKQRFSNWYFGKPSIIVY